jgi:hypothetical protein
MSQVQMLHAANTSTMRSYVMFIIHVGHPVPYYPNAKAMLGIMYSLVMQTSPPGHLHVDVPDA